MRVLVIDDEEVILEFLARSLSAERHTVDVARDGIEGAQRAMKQPQDVIILDVMMPHKSGLEVCRELRAANIHTPIILLTSLDGEAARIEGLDAGADDYLTKPFSYGELSARVRALARRPHRTLRPVIRVGRLQLDTAHYEIALNGRALTLRPKEYALIEYLMRHPDRVVTKEELLRSVWSVSSLNASNRLEVCIHHLRDKLNVEGEVEILHTVRGYGYMLRS